MLHLLPDSHLSWISCWVYIHAEELNNFPYSWNRSIAEYMSMHCDLQSLVLSIHSKIFALSETWFFPSRSCLWNYYSLPACVFHCSKCIHLDSPHFQLQMLKSSLSYSLDSFLPIVLLLLLRTLGQSQWKSHHWQTIKSAISGSLLVLLWIFNTFRDHLSLTLPGSLDNSMQVMSGVFSTFQLCKWSIFSHLTKKFWNLLASASPALIWGHYYISLQYDAVMICGFTNLSGSSRWAVLNPGSEGSQMQYFAISLASPFVNLIKLVSCPLGSVSLFSATSLQTSIK